MELEKIEYLKSLKSIRDRCELVYERIKSGHPEARFEIDEGKLEAVSEFVASLIVRDYPDPSKDVPSHGRWRHFLPIGSIEERIINPLKELNYDNLEIVRILMDLFVVSVLLDAGAGEKWKYESKIIGPIGRSEGLAIASMEMFLSGCFSVTREMKCDADGLLNLKPEDLSKGLQVDNENNPLVGLEGRLDLLKRLGGVLKEEKNKKFFVAEGSARPGNLIYYLKDHQIKKPNPKSIEIDINTLWEVVIEGFGGVWPEEGRCKIGNVCLGDVWPSKILENENENENDNIIENENRTSIKTSNLVTFHKLSQWLTYSLLEPMETLLNWEFINKDQMTGLAEYRNGGLFIDFGVIKLKSIIDNKDKLEFHPNDEVVVQWRALTICLLDRLAPLIRSRLNLSPTTFTLPKLLEGGTWKAGREIAMKIRPERGGPPPINIISDGTVF